MHGTELRDVPKTNIRDKKKKEKKNLLNLLYFFLRVNSLFELIPFAYSNPLDLVLDSLA